MQHLSRRFAPRKCASKHSAGQNVHSLYSFSIKTGSKHKTLENFSRVLALAMQYPHITLIIDRMMKELMNQDAPQRNFKWFLADIEPGHPHHSLNSKPPLRPSQETLHAPNYSPATQLHWRPKAQQRKNPRPQRNSKPWIIACIPAGIQYHINKTLITDQHTTSNKVPLQKKNPKVRTWPIPSTTKKHSYNKNWRN